MSTHNTLVLGNVRPAGSNGEFAPFVFYPNHIVYAAAAGERTHIRLSSGDLMEVDMSIDKFITRQRLDNPDV